jgi:hypothetical protein
VSHAEPCTEVAVLLIGCGANILSHGGVLETCQVLMGHVDSRTIKLYDRRALRPTRADIERIRYASE